MSSSFALLSHHRSIAWDFDGTLIDNPTAYLLWDFIKAHPEIRHGIVTFRSHGMQDTVWEELGVYADAPGPAAFTGILNISDAHFRAYSFAARHHEIGRKPTSGTTRAIQQYLEWKGEVCHQHGFTALVDDNAPHVTLGCERYGVAYFNPADA